MTIGRPLAALFIVNVFAGCSAALHPHTTLDGQAFAYYKLDELQEGQPEEEVREVLGDPLEVSQEAGSTVWRYYEQYHPRECTSSLFGLIPVSRRHIVSIEANVVLRQGVVESLRVSEQR